jgi:hypothetical protein
MFLSMYNFLFSMYFIFVISMYFSQDSPFTNAEQNSSFIYLKRFGSCNHFQKSNLYVDIEMYISKHLMLWTLKTSNMLCSYTLKKISHKLGTVEHYR